MHLYTRGFLSTLLTLLAAAGAAAGPSAVETVQQRGKLIMLSFPHMGSTFVRPDLSYGPTKRVAPAGHFTGIDIELMSSFAESLGVELEVRTLEEPGYAPLIPALLDGTADLLASSLTITADRREQVDFSEPYFTVYPTVITRRDSQIAKIEDLAEHTAVTIAGSSHQEQLRGLGFPEKQEKHVEFTSEYYTEISEGNADFAVVDSITAARDLADFPDLEIAFRLPGEEHYGIALPPGSDLLPLLDRFLARTKANGELQRVIERYLPSQQ